MDVKTEILSDGTPICEVVPDKMKEVIILCHGLGGNKNFFHPLEEKLADINIGIVSFDFPYHGERKNRYNKYTVKNCLKTIDNVYKFVVKKYSNIKIDFMGKSLGSLYLYDYLFVHKPKINKVIFQCLPLDNKVQMNKNFLNNPHNTDKYFCVGYGRKLPIKLLSDLDDLEKQISDIDYIDKRNILFIHGTDDNIASLDKVKKLCSMYHYNLYEIAGADHNFKKNNSKEMLNNKIVEFLNKTIK